LPLGSNRLDPFLHEKDNLAIVAICTCYWYRAQPKSTVVILAISKALSIISADRFSPLEPLGMFAFMFSQPYAGLN
jgi:hypothetical protein